jgi:hypothetical protein
MANFWSAEDKIPIGQTKIAVPAEHGLDYDPGQKVEFHIPASVDFFQPKESYLKFDVELSNPTTHKSFLQLDGQLGGQVLIRDLRIYSGGAGRVLLEEFQNYNVLTAVKYDYELNDTIRQKRGLTEGCVYYDERNRSTTGMRQDTANNISNNPYFDAPATGDRTAAEPTFKKCKCLLPLNTGIFSNDKIFPVGLTDGLIVEIILEEAKHCLRTPDTTMLNRKLFANPIFLSSNGTSDTAAPSNPNSSPQYPKAANGSGFQSFFVRRDNMMGINASVGGSQIPFTVGQRIGFVDVNASTTPVDNPSTGSTTYGTISGIYYDTGTTHAARITLVDKYIPTNAMDANFIVVDKSLDSSTDAEWIPKYKLTDCEFIVQQVQMPAGYKSKLASMMKEGGAMNYDFLSYTNYKTSQVSSEKLTTLRVPLTQSRAKSVLAIPTDASVYTQKAAMMGTGTEVEYYDRYAEKNGRNQNRSVRPGLVGITDNITQYQLFYDGKLNPSRKVKCNKISSKTSIDQQPLIELEKALVMAGIKPHSMLNFQKNFVIGRALSLQDGVYDTRGKDFQLQVEYQETAVPAFNKLWNVWCAHLRRIVISGNSIQVQI